MNHSGSSDLDDICKMGFNTSVSTPFYPLAPLFPEDQMCIIQSGRTITICQIQLWERWPWLPPLPRHLYSRFMHNLCPSAHTRRSLPCSTFPFFSSTSRLLLYNMNYLPVTFIVYCPPAGVEVPCRQSSLPPLLGSIPSI